MLFLAYRDAGHPLTVITNAMSQQERLITVSNEVSLHTLITRPRVSATNPALLLLHYWGGSNTTWRPLVASLRDRYTIVAPSLRGWGASSKPADTRAYSVKNHAADIQALVERLSEDNPEILADGLVLVGHSMGGKIAQYILTNPTIQALIIGLVLLAPAPAGSFALPEGMREQQVHAYDNADSVEYVMRNVLLGQSDAVDSEVVSSLIKDAVGGSDEAKVAWPAYAMAEDYEDEVRTAVMGYAKQHTSLRVMVLVGELDRVELPERVQERTVEMLRRSGADVKTEILKGVGHLSPVEAPERVAEAIGGFI